MISDILFRNPAIDDSRIACKTAEEAITYGELKKRIKSFASYLISGGCRAGDRILIWQNNSIEQLVSYFGVNLIGGIAVLADTKLKQEMEDIIKDNNITLLLTTRKQRDNLKAADALQTVFAEEAGGREEFPADLQSYLERQDFQEDQLSTVLYTSGSAGKPKGVLNTHRNLEEALKNYGETMDFTWKDKFIGVTPFFHSYAFDSCMLVALYRGAQLLLMSSFVPSKVLLTIQEEEATVFHGVPFMYQLMNDQLDASYYDLSSLRVCVSAGSRLNPDCLRRFNQLTGLVIHQEYGSTETGTIAINLSNDVEKAVNYVGKPLQNVDCKLIPCDEDGNRTLMIISKGISAGYMGELPFEREGYLTQDICVIEDDYIRIKGRADRLINITGLKVNPVEVERCLKQHPDIGDAFVKGRKSENFEEAVEAFVVKKRESLTEKELADYCRKNLAAYKVPSCITWVEQIEKSGLGKPRSL